MVILSKRALFCLSIKFGDRLAGSCREKGRLHIDRAGSLKKGAGIKLPQGVAEAAPFFIWEESNMSKNKVIPLCSWRAVPIPQRCEGCPYPKVGFVCYGKDGSCLRSDVQEMEVRQASKKAK